MKLTHPPYKYVRHHLRIKSTSSDDLSQLGSHAINPQPPRTLWSPSFSQSCHPGHRNASPSSQRCSTCSFSSSRQAPNQRVPWRQSEGNEKGGRSPHSTRSGLVYLPLIPPSSSRLPLWLIPLGSQLNWVKPASWLWLEPDTWRKPWERLRQSRDEQITRLSPGGRK